MADTSVKKVAVIHYMGATQKSYSVVASIVADMREKYQDVQVVDIGKFGTIFQESPPEWAVRLVGHKSYRNRFRATLENLGASLEVLEPKPELEVALTDSNRTECLQAIESELLTYFRQEALDEKKHYVRWLRSNLTSQAFACYSAIHRWLSETSPNLVIIPNGRTSRQKVCRVAAESLGISVQFYENGRSRPDSYYLGKTQPHDRVASQKEVGSLTSQLRASEISALARNWLQERMNPSSGTNTFSAGWNGGKAKNEAAHERPRAVFFSSSADEFLAFGPMWNIDEWSTQFHAFDMIMERLSNRGIELILRIHPNLSGKSHTYFLKTVREIRSLQLKYPSLTVHWHNSRVNSYDLAQSADYVIAERSTIALEANLMGKSVWICQAAQWDLIADVRQVLKPSDIDKDDLTPWSVDVSGAERFIAYWVIQERPLHYRWVDWTSWNPEASPLGIKLASLWGKNPLAHKRHLISLEWARFRNNRYKV